jgi:hypothetical protein
MSRHAITFTVTRGSEPEVARILSSYGRPRPGAGGGPPLLRRTSVLMSGNRVVRVMDIEGGLDEALAHLAAQPPIRAVEEALNPYLEQPRDLTGPDSIRRFLAEAQMERVHDRHTPEHLLPEVPPERRGQRLALLYPVRAGRGAEMGRLLAGTRVLAPDRPTILARTTIFVRGDVLVRVVDVDGDIDEALDRLATAAVASGGTRALAELVTTDIDLGDEAGFRSFLSACRMRVLTDRRIGVPV